MKSKDVIPVPPALRWKNFRHRWAPVFVFLINLSAVVLLWQHVSGPMQFVGEVESEQARVISSEAGRILRLHVPLYGRVKAGDLLAEIGTSDPRLDGLDLPGFGSMNSGVLQNLIEWENLDLQLNSNVQRQRNSADFARLRMSWLDHKVQLATSRIELERAKSEMRRAEQLYAKGVISVDEHEERQAVVKALQAGVNEKTFLVEKMGATLDVLEKAEREYKEGLQQGPLKMELALHERRLEQAKMLSEPIRLESPIDGIVTSIIRIEGEFVEAGEALFLIASTEPARIKGYLEQAQALNLRARLEDRKNPDVPLRVQVTTHGPKQHSAITSIQELGAVLEPLPPFMRTSGFNSPSARYLTILLKYPTTEGFFAHPGELVQLAILR